MLPHTIGYRSYELGKGLSVLEIIDEDTIAKDAMLPISKAIKTIRTFLEDPLLPPQIKSEAPELLKTLDATFEYILDMTREERSKKRIGYRANKINELLTIFEAMLNRDPYLSAFRQDHPEPSACGFLMMPFRETPDHSNIDQCIRRVCQGLGLRALRADDHEYSNETLPNIRTYMHGCGFGIAVFERLEHEYFNSNVSLEVGYMLALGKPVCLLKERTLRSLTSDLAGSLYRPFDVQHVEGTIPRVLRKWLKEKRLDRRDLS